MQDARLQVKLKLKYFADLFLFWTEQWVIGVEQGEQQLHKWGAEMFTAPACWHALLQPNTHKNILKNKKHLL